MAPADVFMDGAGFLALSDAGDEHHAAAADFLDTVERSDALRLEWIGPDRFHAAAGLFRRHADKKWSFTDCTSFTIMSELRIRDAFTTDHHFRQAGFVVLLES